MTFFLCCDIETIPQPQLLRPLEDGPPAILPYEPTKDWLEESKSWDAAKVLQALQDGEIPMAATGMTPGLHPTTCQVVQVSFGTRQADGAIGSHVYQIDDYAGDGGGAMEDNMEAWEGFLLRDAFKMLRKKLVDGPSAVLVTFNGKQFDLPVLRWRAALLNVEVPRLPWRNLLYPWDHDKHADLRIVFTEDKRGRGTLQVWADAFGIHAEEHGHEVWRWFRECNWSELRRYAQVEQVTLVEMWERVRAFI